MLYPARRPPSFLDKNVVPDVDAAEIPLLRALLDSGDESIVARDVDGRLRFRADFRNGGDLVDALDGMAGHDEWGSLVSDSRAAILRLYEEVFRHHKYAGRSGSMYGFEGIGSIYWHMVAKLLVAVQEAVVEAQGSGASPVVTGALVDAYWRVRSGLGFNKTAAEYGAFPADPYSHTPAHAGAQQPGMTGQVKEELLTRLLETGVRIDNGEITFDPVLLRSAELLGTAEAWEVCGLDGERHEIEVPAASLGMTLCQVPVIVTRAGETTRIQVIRADGTTVEMAGSRIDRDTSREVFERTGRVARIAALLSDR